MSAIDCVGRFIYLLLKLHLVRIGLQIVGIVILSLMDRVAAIKNNLPSALGLVSVDALVTVLPYLMLIWGLQFIAEPETAAAH